MVLIPIQLREAQQAAQVRAVVVQIAAEDEPAAGRQPYGRAGTQVQLAVPFRRLRKKLHREDRVGEVMLVRIKGQGVTGYTLFWRRPCNMSPTRRV